VLRPLTQDRWVTYATIHPRGARPARVRDLAHALFELAGAPAETAALLDPARSEAALQAAFDDPRVAAADLVVRSLA
jgi:hypothetical protein